MSTDITKADVVDALTPHVLWSLFGDRLFAAMPERYKAAMLNAARNQASYEHQLQTINIARNREGKPWLTMSQFMAGATDA